MFTFFTRFSFRLLILLTIINTGVAALGRMTQSNFAPILYGDTTDSQLYIADLNCGSIWIICQSGSRLLREGLYSFPLADWSPDGEYIVVHMSENWFVYPSNCLLSGQTCEPTVLTEAANDVRLAWGVDGELIASNADSSDMQITRYTRGCWDGSDDCLQTSATLSSTSILTDPTWSADGSRIAYADYLQPGLVWFAAACIDEPQGCEGAANTVNVEGRRISWPSLSADGRTAILTMDIRGNNTYQQLFWVDLETGEVRQLTDRAGTAGFPDWSANGRYILFSGFSPLHGGDLLIYLMDLERQITLPIIHHPDHDVAFATWGYAK